MLIGLNFTSHDRFGLLTFAAFKVNIVFVGLEIKYVVDFDPKLGEIIAETRYMEQLGYLVPERRRRNVALQVGTILREC